MHAQRVDEPKQRGVAPVTVNEKNKAWGL